MRLCWNDKELKEGWESARTEAKAAFGNDGMYMEKFIEEPRHIEIQLQLINMAKRVIFRKEIVQYNVDIKN